MSDIATELRFSFDYDPETGVISDGAGEAGRLYYRKNRPGSRYRLIYFGGRNYAAHRVAWLLVFGRWPKAIDHINGDGADNRLCNLREVPEAVNSRNKKRFCTNKSGVTGVSWNKKAQRWEARIHHNGKKVWLGHYRKFSQAVSARKQAEKRFGYHENHGRPRNYDHHQQRDAA